MSGYVALEHIYKLDASGEPFELWYAPGNSIALDDLDVLEKRGVAMAEINRDDEHALRAAMREAHADAALKTTPGPDTVQAVAAEQREARAEAEADLAAAAAQEAQDAPEPEAEGDESADAEKAAGDAVEDKAVRGPKELKPRRSRAKKAPQGGEEE